MTVANPSSRRALLRTAAALPRSAFGAGCQLPGSSPAPREFRVTAKTTFADDLPEVDWSLRSTGRRPDRDRHRADRAAQRGRVEYYAGAAWVDRPACDDRAAVDRFLPQLGRIASSSTGPPRSGLTSCSSPTSRRSRPSRTTVPGLSAGPPGHLGHPGSTCRTGSGRHHRVRPHGRRAGGDPASIAAAIDEALGKVLAELVADLTTGQAAVQELTEVRRQSVLVTLRRPRGRSGSWPRASASAAANG